MKLLDTSTEFIFHNFIELSSQFCIKIFNKEYYSQIDNFIEANSVQRQSTDTRWNHGNNWHEVLIIS